MTARVRAALLAPVAAVVIAAVNATDARAQFTAPSRGAVLLTLPAGARALALGDAWGAVADDESALFYNPAQLARVGGPTVGISVQRYIASTTLGAGAVAVPLRRGTIAFGVRVLDYGSEDEVIPDAGFGGQRGVPTGASVSAQDIAVTAGYGIAVGDRRRLRLGVALEFAEQHVANVSGGAFAADLGAACTVAGGWEVSAALQHLGSALRLAAVRSPLPWTWRTGVAAPAFGAGALTLRPMVELRQASGGATIAVVAAEGMWRAALAGPAFSARAAFAMRRTGDDRSPLTFGGGIALGRVAVDYAYEGFDALGATHRVGVRFAALPGAR